jgi:hypothetical protein
VLSVDGKRWNTEGIKNQLLSTLIHSCQFKKQLPVLGQYWIGRVGQNSIGADTTDTPNETSPDYVLVGSGKTRRTQNKITPDKDSRSKFNEIPTRIESMFILVANHRGGNGLLLTREELDINPKTKNLPNSEKDEMVKYWPRFVHNQDRVREIRITREQDAAIALKAHKTAAALTTKHGLDEMTLPEQMRITAKVIEQNIQHGALVLAATTIDEVGHDRLSNALLKNRFQFMKDSAWLRDKLCDIADRIEQANTGTLIDSTAKDEALALLQSADAALIRRGQKTVSNGE